MKRTRTLNAAPERSSIATVEVMSKLVIDSLAGASNLEQSDVAAALKAAAPGLLILTSGRHLWKTPVVLVAGDTICEIYCRYDNEALGGAENLNPIPGTSTAEDFSLHLPAPEPLTSAIAAVVSGHPALTTELAPLAPPQKVCASASMQAPLDLKALKEIL